MTALASRGQLRASFIRWALFTVPLVLLLGFVSGQVGGDARSAWFQGLEKPSIFPPPMWFGIVWSILYAMMGFALALVCAAWGARWRGVAIGFFALQLLVNLAWSPVFFGLHDIRAALVAIGVLDVLVIITIALFWRIRWLAGALLLPYLAWILFATVLNWQFLQANPDGGREAKAGAVERYEF